MTRCLMLALVLGAACTGCSKKPSEAEVPTKTAGADDKASKAKSLPEVAGTDEATAAAAVPAIDPELSVTELVDKVGSSVVFLTSRNVLGDAVATGSGFIIDTEGIIVTNRHVIEDAFRVEVQFKDESKTDVTGYVAVDHLNDLAVLTVGDIPESATALSLERPSPLRQGDELVAIGHPASFKFTVTTGVVSALRTTEELPDIYQEGLHANPETRWIQTNAAISGGSSGGPLFNNRGHLVGITTWIAGGQSLGFAVDAHHLVDLMASRAETRTPLPVPGAYVFVTPEVHQLWEDYARDKQQLFIEARQKSDAERLDWMKENHPSLETTKKLHEIATTSDSQSARIDAIAATFHLNGDSSEVFWPGYLADMIKQNAELAQSPAVGRLAVFGTVSPYSPPLADFLRVMADENPDEYCRATASFALLTCLERGNTDAEHLAEMTQLASRMRTEFAGFVTPSGQSFRLAGERVERLYKHLLAGYSVVEDLVGKDVSDQPLRLSDFRGKHVLLTFFRDADPASRACYEELKKVHSRPGNDIVVLGVCSDEPSRAKAALSDRKRVPWQSWLDPESEITQRWQITQLPTSFLLDPTGFILGRIASEPGHKNLNKTIDEKLVHEALFEGDLLTHNTKWRYAAGPIENWAAPDFDDSGWNQTSGRTGYGHPGVSPIDVPRGQPVCFRTTLSLPETPRDFLINAKYNDGIAIYVDGHEVYRRNAPSDGSKFAFRLPPEKLGASRYIALDPAVIRPGQTHTLAAVVYPRSRHDQDLVFSVSATGTLPTAAEISKDDFERVRVTYADLLLMTLGSPVSLASDLPPLVEKDKTALVREMMKALTIARTDTEKRIPPAGWVFGTESRAARSTLSTILNNRAWSNVVDTDVSAAAVDQAVRWARAAHALSVKVDKSTTANTLGVALLRAGRFDEALKRFEESDRMDPCLINTVCIGLARLGLGDRKQAQTILEEADAKLLETQDSYDDTVQFVEDLRRQLAKQDDLPDGDAD